MKNKSKAFTLIELLIAMSMAISIIAVLFFYTQVSLKTLNKAEEISKSAQVVRFVTSKMIKDISESSGAMNGSTANKLILEKITYEYISNKIKRTEGSEIYYLTIENEVLNMSFLYPSSKFIQISIDPRNGDKYNINVYARN